MFICLMWCIFSNDVILFISCSIEEKTYQQLFGVTDKVWFIFCLFIYLFIYLFMQWLQNWKCENLELLSLYIITWLSRFIQYSCSLLLPLAWLEDTMMNNNVKCWPKKDKIMYIKTMNSSLLCGFNFYFVWSNVLNMLWPIVSC